MRCQVKRSNANLNPNYRFWAVLAIFLLVQAFVWLVLFQFYWPKYDAIAGIHGYFFNARQMADGSFPYRDFSIEYPPLFVPVFYLPSLFSGPAYDKYLFWFGIETLFFSCGISLLTAMFLRARGCSLRHLTAALLTYVLSVSSIGYLIQIRFDIIVAFFLMASLTCFMREKIYWAWLFLGLGAMLKIIPLLLAPLYLLFHYRHRQWEKLWRGPLAMAAMALSVSLPFALAAPTGLAHSFKNQFIRPLQLESTWSLPFLWAKKLTGYPVKTTFSFGSDNIIAPHAGAVAALATAVLLILLGLGYFRFYRTTKQTEEKREHQDALLRFSAIALVVFIAFNKVFSPQYVIWLLPFVPLGWMMGRRYLAGLLAIIMLLTQYEYPSHYEQLVGFKGAMIAELTLRNFLLVVLLLVLLLPPITYKRDPV